MVILVLYFHPRTEEKGGRMPWAWIRRNKVIKTLELLRVEDTKTKGTMFSLAEVHANLPLGRPSARFRLLSHRGPGGCGWWVGFVDCVTRPDIQILLWRRHNSPCPQGSVPFYSLFYHPSIPPKNWGCGRKCSLSFRGQEQGTWRDRTLEGKESLQNLGQGSDLEWRRQPGSLDRLEPLYLVQRCRVHGT